MVFTMINNQWRIFDTKEEAAKAVAKEVRGHKNKIRNRQFVGS